MDKKNKIAIVVYTLSSGGLERVVANQTFLFSKMGYEVSLFVLENNVSYDFEAKFYTYDFKKDDSIFSKLMKYKLFKKDIQQGNFDFVMDHRYRLNGFMEVFWLKYLYKNQKKIYFIHSSDIKSYVNMKWVKNTQIEFIAVSEGVENLSKSQFSNLKIQTIYNNVDVEEEIVNFPEKFVDYILAVGRMDNSNVKQFDILIDCYSKSVLPQKNIKLLILGEGVLLDALRKQVIDLNLQDLVCFKGFEKHLYSYYSHAKFLVLSSKYEGLGMVLIESLMCETPVVSFDCDFGPSEIITNKYNGLLVENQNKIELTHAMNSFIEDEKLYVFCKRNSKRSVFKFSEESISKKWQKFFNDKH